MKESARCSTASQPSYGGLVGERVNAVDLEIRLAA
jgi:hypothetical protein